jgi:uncharacterized OB-fold protein
VSDHPRPDPVGADDARFWSFVAAGEFRVQQCTGCGTIRYPPRPLCATCRSTGAEWAPVSGRGEVWAVTTVHPPTLPAFASRAPYDAVVVRLSEGVFVVSNVLGADPGEIEVGAQVEMAIVEVEPGLHLPQFRRLARP